MAPLVDTRAAVSQFPIRPYGYTCLTLQRGEAVGTNVDKCGKMRCTGARFEIKWSPGAEVRLRDRRRGLLDREGDHGIVHRDHPEGPWPQRLPPEAGPLYQHRPRHPVALSARRCLRHR